MVSLFISVISASLLAASSAHDLTLAEIDSAFSSQEGLLLRAAECSLCDWDLNLDRPSSASVWRYDTPLALWSPPGTNPPDTVGVIYAPSSRVTSCAYTVDANSNVRCSPSKGSMPHASGESKSPKASGWSCPPGTVHDHCGMSSILFSNLSGTCPDESSETYVSRYFYKPIMYGIWNLESANCHFTSVSRMLDAQRALLNRSMTPPHGVTAEMWLANATRIGFGLTAFNEVIVLPGSEAGALFWAHAGSFRSPTRADPGACTLGEYFRNATTASHPVFEVSFVNLERPFQDCYGRKGIKPDCLSRGLGEWSANVTQGRRASMVFRAVAPSVFMALEC